MRWSKKGRYRLLFQHEDAELASTFSICTLFSGLVDHVKVIMYGFSSHDTTVSGNTVINCEFQLAEIVIGSSSNCFLGFWGFTQSMTSVAFCMYIFLFWVECNYFWSHIAFKGNLSFKNNPGQGIGERRGPQGVELFFSFQSTITLQQQQQQLY